MLNSVVLYVIFGISVAALLLCIFVIVRGLLPKKRESEGQQNHSQAGTDAARAIGTAQSLSQEIAKPSTYQGRPLNEAQQAKMAAMAATDSNGNMIAEGDTVHIIGKIKQVVGNDPHKAVVIRVDKVNQNKPEGTDLNLYANQVESYQYNLPQAFSGTNILIQPGTPGLYIAIFPANPGVHGSPSLWVTPGRSETEIQITILSTDAIELRYVKADIIGPNNTNVTTLERNESVVIPAFNPRAETVKRPLTPSELQRFGDDRATWFQVSGFAKFKGPKGEELKINFEFGTTAWRYGQPS